MLELEYHVIQLTNTDVTAVTVALWARLDGYQIYCKAFSRKRLERALE